MGAVTLLPRYDRNNGWFETLPEVPPAAPLIGPTEADVVVVGAGFTGLAAARRLAELRPGARVLLVEAGRIGNSAAGRSSGFAIDHAHNIRSEGFADSAAYERQQIALNRAGQAYLAEAVKAHGIDCDWTWAGKTHAACTDHGARDLDRFAASLDLIGEDHELLDRDATVDRLGIDYYHRALHTPGTVLLQPAALCRGLAAFLPMRLPRLIAAASAGAALAMAGAILQRLTANPLASPEVLGVSGGASLGYAAVVFVAVAPTAALLGAGATIGGAVALALVAAFTASRDMPPERILLAGIAISALATAVLSAIMATGDARSWVILGWLAGSSSGVGMRGALALSLVAAGMLAACLGVRRWLALMPLGGETAIGLGLPLRRARLFLILLSGIGTGAATVLVGPLSFVGLMAPHLARRLGLARPSHHVTGAALIGAGLMLAADFGSRMAGFPYDLPLGLFASLLGAPWLIWLITRRPG